MSMLARSHLSKQRNKRNRLAKAFLRGSGMEIGALASPVNIPHGEVSYYDCNDFDTLAEIYQENADGLVALDGIENIETLFSIDDQSQDFVIACQVLEYCSNVLAAFHALARALKSQGILFLSVCDKRFSEDRRRPATPLGHLAADYVHGPTGSWAGHVQEWATFHPRFSQIPDPAQRLEAACANASRLRQHLWTPSNWIELVIHIQAGMGLELVNLTMANKEMLTILRKI